MTVRVFIASTPDGLDAEANLACEYSIRSRCSEPVEVTFMRLNRDPQSPWYSAPERGRGWVTSNWVTPFSGLRWAIPAACGYEGRAIYCDNDTLWLADAAELFNMDLQPGKAVAAKNGKRFCVMLIDCARARPHVPELRELMAGAPSGIKNNPALIQDFGPGQNWNVLDGEDLPVDQIKCLHFTSIDSQPNVPLAIARLEAEGLSHWFDANPKPHWRPELSALWHSDYAAALAAGYRLEDYDQQPRFGPVPKRSLAGYRGLKDR